MKYQINIEEKDIDHFRNILISSLNSCTYLSKRGAKLARELLDNIIKIQTDIAMSETLDGSVNTDGEARNS